MCFEECLKPAPQVISIQDKGRVAQADPFLRTVTAQFFAILDRYDDGSVLPSQHESLSAEFEVAIENF